MNQNLAKKTKRWLISWTCSRLFPQRKNYPLGLFHLILLSWTTNVCLRNWKQCNQRKPNISRSTPITTSVLVNSSDMPVTREESFPMLITSRSSSWKWLNNWIMATANSPSICELKLPNHALSNVFWWQKVKLVPKTASLRKLSQFTRNFCMPSKMNTNKMRNPSSLRS